MDSKDFEKIAKAGSIPEGELLDLRRLLRRLKTDRELLLEDRRQALAYKKQRAFLIKLNAALQHPQINSLVTAGAQRRSAKQHVGEALDAELDRISKGTSGYYAFKEFVSIAAAEVQHGPLIPVRLSAAKEEADAISLGILMYLGFHGRLGDTAPKSDEDTRVLFAWEIIKVIERGSVKSSAARCAGTLTAGAVRLRLRRVFDLAKAVTTKRPPSLVEEQRARAQWKKDACTRFRELEGVSEQDAKDFADALPVDVNSDPADVVRRTVTAWSD